MYANIPDSKHRGNFCQKSSSLYPLLGITLNLAKLFPSMDNGWKGRLLVRALQLEFSGGRASVFAWLLALFPLPQF